MLPPGPVEELFRVVVWLVIGIPIALLLLSVFTTLLTVKLTFVFLAVGVFVAAVGYLIGIPWSIWFRATHGRWPE